MATTKKPAPKKAAKPSVKSSAKKAPVKASAKKVEVKKPVAKAASKMDDRMERVIKHLVGITESTFEKFYPKGSKADKSSAKKAQLEAAIASFGGYAEDIAKIMSILTGEKISAPKGDASRHGIQAAFVPGAVFVPLANPNSHNYKIGQPAMALHHLQSNCLRMTGDEGNNMDLNASSLRPATEAEITAFVKANYDKIVKRLAIMFV